MAAYVLMSCDIRFEEGRAALCEAHVHVNDATGLVHDVLKFGNGASSVYMTREQTIEFAKMLTAFLTAPKDIFGNPEPLLYKAKPAQ